MDLNFVQGMLGGIVPAVLMVLFYLIAVSGRLARIETNIFWIMKYIKKCPPPLNDRTP